MGIHQRIVQFNNYVCRQLAESPDDTNRHRYITSHFIYMVFKRKIFIERYSNEFDCWNFRKDWILTSRILMSNSFFLVGDYHIWSFTNVQRKSVGLDIVINSYQFPVDWGMNIVNITVECKNCCIVSKMDKAHLVWGSIHIIDAQKKSYWVQHRSLRDT